MRNNAFNAPVFEVDHDGEHQRRLRNQYLILAIGLPLWLFAFGASLFSEGGFGSEVILILIPVCVLLGTVALVRCFKEIWLKILLGVLYAMIMFTLLSGFGDMLLANDRLPGRYSIG